MQTIGPGRRWLTCYFLFGLLDLVYCVAQADCKLTSLSPCLYFVSTDITDITIMPRVVYARESHTRPHACQASSLPPTPHPELSLCYILRASKCWCPFSPELLEFLLMAWNTADSARAIHSSVLWTICFPLNSAGVHIKYVDFKHLDETTLFLSCLSWPADTNEFFFDFLDCSTHQIFRTVTAYHIDFKWFQRGAF